MVKKMGKSPVFFAFPGNAIVVSFGEGGLKAIQQGLGNIAKEPAAEPAEPAALQSRLSLLGQFVDPNPDTVRKVASEVFQGASASRTACGSVSRPRSKRSGFGSRSMCLRSSSPS